MSLTFFGARNLTTEADLCRKPALSRGQLGRTVALFFLAVAALALVARHAPADATLSDNASPPTTVDR